MYYYFVHTRFEDLEAGSLLTHTHTLSLSKYVKKICVLCGRGGERRGGEGKAGGMILAGRSIMVVFVFKFWAKSCMAT